MRLHLRPNVRDRTDDLVSVIMTSGVSVFDDWNGRSNAEPPACRDHGALVVVISYSTAVLPHRA